MHCVVTLMAIIIGSQGCAHTLDFVSPRGRCLLLDSETPSVVALSSCNREVRRHLSEEIILHQFGFFMFFPHSHTCTIAPQQYSTITFVVLMSRRETGTQRPASVQSLDNIARTSEFCPRVAPSSPCSREHLPSIFCKFDHTSLVRPLIHFHPHATTAKQDSRCRIPSGKLGARPETYSHKRNTWTAKSLDCWRARPTIKVLKT